MKLILRVVVLGLLFLSGVPLSVADGLASKAKPQIKFEYEMSGKDAQKLEAGVARLKKGVSLDVVKGLLGKPDSERILVFGRESYGEWSNQVDKLYMDGTFKVIDL